MNQLLESIAYEPDGGKLTLQAARYMLIRPELLVELQKAIETHLPHEANEILSAAAQNDGVTLASRLKEIFSYSEEQILSSMAFMLAESGWGLTSPEMVNVERMEIVLKVTSSPFAEEYGPSVNPVCHFLLGLFQGAAMVMFEREIDGQEVQCVARGDDVCRFVVTGRP